ncbi:hypothetical protein D6745_04485, partial [Candidatus Woesearchaeota archaeon]
SGNESKQVPLTVEVVPAEEEGQVPSQGAAEDFDSLKKGLEVGLIILVILLIILGLIIGFNKMRKEEEPEAEAGQTYY